MTTATNERAEMLHTNLSVNEKGHLCFAGMDTVELAKKHGTALYLIDENNFITETDSWNIILISLSPNGFRLRFNTSN